MVCTLQFKMSLKEFRFLFFAYYNEQMFEALIECLTIDNGKHFFSKIACFVNSGSKQFATGDSKPVNRKRAMSKRRLLGIEATVTNK